MPNILIVTKNGFIQETEMIPELLEMSILYKVAGFRNNNGFLLQEVFTVSLNNSKYKIALYGKTKGKMTHINKYSFFTKKYIGNCLLLRIDCDESILSFTLYEWNQIKDHICSNIVTIPSPCVIISKKPIKITIPSKIMIKKKEVKTIINKIEEKNTLNPIYLDCSKELTFENYI